jgi:hypothetical protein
VILALAAAANAQTAAPQSPSPVQTNRLPFGTQIRKTVLFIELQCKDGKQFFTAQGTAFVVGWEAPEVGKGNNFEYLVTNRHVALCWNEQNQPMEVLSVSIRGNLKDGTSQSVPLNANGNLQWIFPKDASVDLAVSPILPPPTADVLLIPSALFATKAVMSEKQVVEGSRIMFTGFFYQFPGERKIQPIVREGILAMVPDEPLKTFTGLPGTVYLGDVHIFRGNSGSPVFVDVAAGFGYDYRFLGVVSGNFSEDQDFNLQIDTTISGKERANSGIAIIVPADELKSLIDNDPFLKAGREATIKSALAKK